MHGRRGWPLLLWVLLVNAGPEPSLTLSADDERQLAPRMESFYGAEGGQRFYKWRALIHEQRLKPEASQLEAVNHFFNQQLFVDDLLLWQQEDFWASPLEFIGAGAGDCEDFAIAKYFTLLELGVSEDKLRITYVKALKLNQFHMVLAYYPRPDAEPLILDNLIDEVKKASKRTDLLPIYNFNASSLWLAKAQGSGQRVGSSERLGLWQGLRQRMLGHKWQRPPALERQLQQQPPQTNDAKNHINDKPSQ